MTRRWFVLVLVVGLALTAPAGAQMPMPENEVPRAVETTARHLTHDLRQEGYEVARGYFKLYTQDDCQYSYEVLHSCLGNNPAAPYVIPVVPPWPDEWVDPGTAGMIGPTVEGYNASHRFDPREAIVILAQLPPLARYFGLQTYLFSRPGEWHDESDQYGFVADKIPAMLDTFFTKLPRNQERLQLFADLSDPINNAVIQNKSSAVWDQVRYFVITPDKNMEGAVRQALARLGIPEEDVFTEQIPSMLGDTNMAIGLGEESDDFLTLLRYAMPVDAIRADSWQQRLPMVVLRIRDTRADHQPQPYPWIEFEDRSGTEPPETDLAPNLVMLAMDICDRWDQPCQPQDLAPLVNMKVSDPKLTGPECVKVGMNCLAPNEDAVYFMGKRLWLPDNQRVYAVIGALGIQTDNATYVGLGLNSSANQLGFDNIEDDTLAGTANEYTDVPNHDRFFLYYFARDCTVLDTDVASHCYSIGNKLPDCPDPNPDPKDLECTMLVLSLRNYLFPSSKRGPAPELTLNPLVITLQRPQETE